MLTLKKEVLRIAKIEEMAPQHCKTLSELIYKKTNKKISITTLKRVYGFATSKHQISSYTTSVLQEFSQVT
ncbi:hypothetical protein [Mucilaginibacter sp. SP1R1]|uniref:hypothetical protein n=1 Tax=Mucilaginibacter sp. SP1R1 TaxID=2723091 RepID=UPI00161FB4EB|nr:hypothetical protein [Mucilaginibacter sp. SP1R1]MBB6148292.1 hypothetical protein [Mucilaginibacter sp. SP1R1]